MANLLSNLIGIYIWVVIIRVVLSWLDVDTNNAFVKFLSDITDPVLSKIRDVVPAVGGFDLSPLVLIIGLSIVRSLLY